MAELAWRSFADHGHGRQTGGIEVRLIVRRVPPSPGIQAPLFPTFSYHPFTTDQPGDVATLDQLHREHARVENVIKDLKDAAGLEHLPSGRFGANGAWLVFATIAHNLARRVGRFGTARGAPGKGCSGSYQVVVRGLYTSAALCLSRGVHVT